MHRGLKRPGPAALVAITMMCAPVAVAQNTAAPTGPSSEALIPSVPPAATDNPAPAAPEATQAKPVAKDTAQQPKPAKPKPDASKQPAAAGPEILPWAKSSAGDAAAAAKPVELPKTSALCAGLYEAACRETTGCSWIADIKLESGKDIKAHCVDRAPTGAASSKPAKKPAGTTAQKPKPALQKPAADKGLPPAQVGAAPAAAPVPTASSSTSSAAPVQ